MRYSEIITLSAPRNRAPGQVRIISGQWRGTKLPVMLSNGLRPTTDRTKETVFNWLMHTVRDCHCADLFAGAGSLGFEALSRGAAHAFFIEKDNKTATSLKQNISRLNANAHVVCTEAQRFLMQTKTTFDLVFVDPPYNAGLVEPSIALLIKNRLLNDNAMVYVEHEITLTLPDFPELNVVKEKSTSQFRYALYRYSAT